MGSAYPEKYKNEHPAFLIIDMLKDNFDEGKNLPITPLAKEIIAPINSLISVFRREGWPIVFSTDAFHEEDFIFKGRMKPHSLAGTEGAEVIDELDRKEEDLSLPKPRHDFKVALLEDCSAALDKDIHQQILAVYRRNPLYPLLKVMTSSELVADLTGKGSPV
jgi:nicotinamidase-related amidase